MFLKESQFGNVKKPISVIKCPKDASFLVYKKCTFKSINGKMFDPLTMKILSINSHFLNRKYSNENLGELLRSK